MVQYQQSIRNYFENQITSVRFSTSTPGWALRKAIQQEQDSLSAASARPSSCQAAKYLRCRQKDKPNNGVGLVCSRHLLRLIRWRQILEFFYVSWLWPLTFLTDNWLSTYFGHGEHVHQFWFFCIFHLPVTAYIGQTDGQTDGWARCIIRPSGQPHRNTALMILKGLRGDL